MSECFSYSATWNETQKEDGPQPDDPGRDNAFRALILGCLGLLGLLGLALAWRARARKAAISVASKNERLAKGALPPGLGFAAAGQAEIGAQAEFGERQVLAMVLQRQEQASKDSPEFILLRDRVLVALFVLYVLCCLLVPTLFFNQLECGSGLPWEVHMIFLALFVATKACELWIYKKDPTLGSPLPVFTEGRYNIFGGFLFKFCMSFMAYFDAYQDAVAAATAFKCPAPASQRLAPWMAGYYVLGVVVLQWGVVAALSWTDPTRSCWLKLLHMDSVCGRLTLPPEFKKTWSLTQIARTVGEDIPQGITQALYVETVEKNPFMILSICCAVGSSLLAAKDALMRRLLASGGVQQQVLLQAADEHVHSLHAVVFPPGSGFGVSKLVLARSGRQDLQFGHSSDRCDRRYFLLHDEHLVQVRVAHHGGRIQPEHVRAIEFRTSRGRSTVFGDAHVDFDWSAEATTGQQIVGLTLGPAKSELRILGIKEAEIPKRPNAAKTSPVSSPSAREGESESPSANLI